MQYPTPYLRQNGAAVLTGASFSKTAIVWPRSEISSKTTSKSDALEYSKRAVRHTWRRSVVVSALFDTTWRSRAHTMRPRVPTCFQNEPWGSPDAATRSQKATQVHPRCAQVDPTGAKSYINDSQHMQNATQLREEKKTRKFTSIHISFMNKSGCSYVH